MSFLEWLKAGSGFHKVSLKPNGAFTIQAADYDSDEGRERFNEIVDQAISNALFEDYEIDPHHSNQDPSGRWDFAIVTPNK